MTPLSEGQLGLIMPRVNAALWTDPLNEAMARFAIDTPGRVASFLAHVAHESDECNRLIENLHYTAARLCAVWPKRFPTLDAAAPYASNPEKLANRVYADRMGNGDEASGDGWLYRGRGLIQLTGRASYRTAGDSLGLRLEEDPDVVALSAFVAALTAAWFWGTNGLNELADDGDQRLITRRINGGLTGFKDRVARVARAQDVLAATAASRASLA